jgi:hypothetical protein
MLRSDGYRRRFCLGMLRNTVKYVMTLVQGLKCHAAGCLSNGKVAGTAAELPNSWLLTPVSLLFLHNLYFFLRDNGSDVLKGLILAKIH